MDTSTLSGLIGKGITITTNDADQPKQQVVVRARILGSVQLRPGNKAILSNGRIATKAQSFLIQKELDETGDLVVTAARASVPWIAVAVERVEEKRPSADGLPSAFPGDWILTAALKGVIPAGRFQEWVRFETGLPREPEITIHIAANLFPPVNLNDQEVSLIAGEPKILLASLRQDLEPQPVRLSGPAGLTAETEPGPRRLFKIHLEWIGDLPHGPVELRIEVAGETQTVPLTISAAE